VALRGLVHRPEARVPVGRNVELVAPEPALTPVPHELNCRALSIAGGTDEVPRHIVAKLVLGLWALRGSGPAPRPRA
jgi:hypothetical protein